MTVYFENETEREFPFDQEEQAKKDNKDNK